MCLFIKENDEKSMRNVLLSKGIDFISEVGFAAVAFGYEYHFHYFIVLFIILTFC